MQMPFGWTGVAIMLEEQEANAASPDTDDPEKEAVKSKRERSTIDFPYADLDDAIEVASAIYEKAGTSCTIPQLAGYLDLSPASSGLRLRIACARMFGLTEKDGGLIRLTELGKRITDPQTGAAAKIEAFLAVPLFAGVQREYEGYQLPPAAALQRKMQELGVSSKQADRARQVFDRSARQAGFMTQGSDRFVTPSIKAQSSHASPLRNEQHSRTLPRDNAPSPGGGRGGGGDNFDLHPFIEGLLKSLPAPETEWNAADRVKWLRAASHIFDLIYQGEGSVTIEQTS